MCMHTYKHKYTHMHAWLGLCRSQLAQPSYAFYLVVKAELWGSRNITGFMVSHKTHDFRYVPALSDLCLLIY